MWKRLAPTLLFAALASCGAGNNAANQTSGESPVANATLAKFAITSTDIANGKPIPQVHTCDGADQSPQLSWPEAPPGTRSFALVMDDPDAPSGTFRHWGVFNMPATRTAIERGEGNGPSNTIFVQAVNDFGKSGYGGPCPPKGHGPHRYRFKLYALDVDKLTLPADAKIEQVEAQAEKHQIAFAEITGTYERH
jgi:Raf kinase inhibitor-like YbhB/YbcL family protein